MSSKTIQTRPAIRAQKGFIPTKRRI